MAGAVAGAQQRRRRRPDGADTKQAGWGGVLRVITDVVITDVVITDVGITEAGWGGVLRGLHAMASVE